MFDIYGKTNCVWCESAKNLLERRGFKYRYRNIEEDADALNDFKYLFPAAKTVPQILHDLRYIGGYSELNEYIG